MLGYIRESMQGWIAWSIIGLLIIPFALWGINEYFGGSGPLVVATVNGEEISQQAYQDAFSAQRDRMRQMLRGQYNPDLFDAQLKQQAPDELISRELLVQNADENDFRVAKQSVVQYIQSIDAFQDDGKFSNDRYVSQLRASSLTPTGFEQRVQRDILIRQMYAAFSSSAFVTDADLQKINALKEQLREVSYLQIPSANYKKEDVASEDAIKKYYDGHLDQYMTDEQVSIQYVELNSATLDVGGDFSEEELKQYYKDRQNQYASTAERKTSHILIAVEDASDVKAIEAARKKAQEIKAKLDKGESFKALAEKYSQDPGSAKLGGDIGYFGKGSLDPNYEKTMFAMKVGEISEPVLSSFGFHIIKLDEVREEEVKPFEAVRAEIVKELKKEATNKKYLELSEKLTNLAYEVHDSLSDAAGAIGAEVKTTGLFSRRGGEGIAANPKIASAAFSNEVLQQGYNSEPVELGENHIAVLRVKDHKEKTQRALEEVKDSIKTLLIANEAKVLAQKVGKETVESLQKELTDQTKSDIAKSLNLQWKEAGAIKRTETKVDSVIVKQVFKTPRPTDDKSSVAGVKLPSGDYVVFIVNKVTDGKLADLDAAKKATLQKDIAGAFGTADFENFTNGLKETASIVKQQNNI